MKLIFATAILLPAIYVLLAMVLNVSSHASPKKIQLEKQDKKEIEIINELHNFHNSLYKASIEEIFIDCPVKSITEK